MNMNKVIKGVNWNVADSNYIESFWQQNVKQFWLPDEFVPSKDIKQWSRMTEAERDTYKKVLGGLTMLDTEQGSEGMPLISLHVPDLQKKAVLSFMGTMEHIHARSYSTIFMTLASNDEIADVFDWVEENKYLQHKGNEISRYYTKLLKDKVPNTELYMAMVASVFLESWLFYSGFFYPLYLAGQGRMQASGEIINLIVRDESVHGTLIGVLAQELYLKMTPEEQQQVDLEVAQLQADLMRNELKYTELLYADIGLDHKVKKFVKYNCDQAMMNLGREPIYNEEDIDPIVLNGLSTDTKTHDFFSTKGNGYQKGKVVDITSDTISDVNSRLLRRKTFM